MDSEREQQKIKGGAVQRPAPTEPRATGEQKCQNVENHAVGERIDLVEKKFERRALGCVGLFLRQRAGEKIDLLIKERSIARAIGITNLCIRFCDRIDFPFAIDWTRAFAD